MNATKNILTLGKNKYLGEKMGGQTRDTIAFAIILLIMINLGNIIEILSTIGKSDFYVLIGQPLPFWLYVSGYNPRTINLLYLAIDLTIPVILGFAASYLKNTVMKK